MVSLIEQVMVCLPESLYLTTPLTKWSESTLTRIDDGHFGHSFLHTNLLKIFCKTRYALDSLLKCTMWDRLSNMGLISSKATFVLFFLSLTKSVQKVYSM